MKAVILAAGEGSRMRPLTFARPKVMLPIANRPLMEHLLIAGSQAGIADFIFVVGYRDDRVRDYFGDGSQWGVQIEYSLQRDRLGTADALGKVKDLVGGSFLVMNGDVLTGPGDLRGLAGQNGLALAGKNLDSLDGLGAVEVNGGRITRIHEKTASPPTNLANAGFYRLSPLIFDAITSTPLSPRGEVELTDSLQLLIDRGEEIRYYPLESWLNFTYPWNLLDANPMYMPRESQNRGIIEGNVSIQGPCSIGEGTRIRSGSYITGPVVIGNNCDIGPNCFIRPATAIGDSCHIGASVEVKNSIIMRGTKVPHLSYVGDSVIGQDCNLGAGTMIANLRFDGKNVVAGGVESKRRKLGAVLGDGVRTGINVSINPGTLIGDGAMIGPGVTVSGSIAPESRIFQDPPGLTV